MRIRLWLSLLLVLALAGAGLAQPVPQASGTAALAHVTALSVQIGPRPAGTPADTKGAEYIAEQLRKLGYKVELQAFPFYFFEETQPPVLTIVAPAAEKLNPVTLQFSASTPERGLETEVVAVGLAREQDLRDRRLEGKIALAERGVIRFSEKVENAAAAGAAAVVVYNNQPGPPISATLAGPSRIPAVMISQEEGQSLLRRLGAGGPVRLRLLVRAATSQRTSHNVIGIKPGTRAPGEIVVVGGHRDSVPVSPGANDNASGIAAMLEAARLLASTPAARTIHFVAFGAEEIGLVGSSFYVHNPAGKVVGMVNMDMVGNGPMQIGNSNGNPTLPDVADQVARRLGITVRRFRLEGSSSSDHASFEQAGVPTVFIHTGDDPVIHTSGDVIDRVDPALLAEAAAIAAGVALQVANGR